MISNEAWYQGARPRPLKTKALGSSLRVALWNIERGLTLDEIKLMLTDPNLYLQKVRQENTKPGKEKKKVRNFDPKILLAQIKRLQEADVWVLNEVDWGVKRTGYREVIRELGTTLNMNWAYGVEFVEIDPKQIGTANFEVVEDEKERKELLEQFKVDKDRLRALHGSAVLSRYPIRDAKLIPYKTGYDWYEGAQSTGLPERSPIPISV